MRDSVANSINLYHSVEKDLHNMVAYGGVDALIWLCRSSKSIKLHHLTTTILALLAEKGKSGEGVFTHVP